MIPEAAYRNLREAARIIKNSKHTVIFSGAGISTPSGIPDFRSAGDGLWQKNDPMKVASLSAFRYHPEIFFAWLKPLLQTISKAKPNLAHTSLVQMELAGKVQAVITQNIDSLHQLAGSRVVYPIHGSLETLVCSWCNNTYQMKSYLDDFLQQDILPRCPCCGRYLKPDIVLFEEELPMETWSQAVKQVEQAQVLLVVGTSLEVYPASILPRLAVDHHARLIINTLSKTDLDNSADVLLPYNTQEVLPLLAEMVVNS